MINEILCFLSGNHYLCKQITELFESMKNEVYLSTFYLLIYCPFHARIFKSR